MDLKLPTMPHLMRSTRRDPGISLRRSERHWMLALVVAALVTAIAVSIALFELYMAEQEDPIFTDPVATARYRSEDVKNALERYDARKEGYVIGAPVPVPKKQIPAVEAAPEVAAPPSIRVE